MFEHHRRVFSDDYLMLCRLDMGYLLVRHRYAAQLLPEDCKRAFEQEFFLSETQWKLPDIGATLEDGKRRMQTLQDLE
jgi:hypothetical protein